MRLKVVALLAFFLVVAALYVGGVYERVDAHRIREWVRLAGALGGVAFVAAYAILQPLGVRSIFFLLSAPLIWSPAEAVLLSWLGAVVASALAFGFARFIARDWAQAHASERIRKLDERLASDGFRTVTLLRLAFYATPALQLALGVSRVRVGAFLWGTALGVVPFTVFMTLFGTELSALFWRWVS